MWGPGLKLHVSLTAALEGVELSASHFCHFMPLYPLPSGKCHQCPIKW